MELPDEVDMIVKMTARLTQEASGARSPGSQGMQQRFDRRFRKAKKDVQEFRITSDWDAGKALALAQEVLVRAGGEVYATAGTAESGTAMRGMLRLGMQGWTLAVVTFTVPPRPEGPAVGGPVLVRTMSVEGLIKQHGGRKAADRLREVWAAGDPSARFD